MFDGLQGLDIVRDSGLIRKGHVRDWVITARSQRGHSLKIEAHDDGYKNQSYVRISLWSDTEGWKRIVVRDGYELTLGGTDEIWVRHMDADIDDVTLEAATLLGLME